MSGPCGVSASILSIPARSVHSLRHHMMWWRHRAHLLSSAFDASRASTSGMARTTTGWRPSGIGSGWSEGCFVRDDDPAIYIHRHEFPHHDARVARTGILTRVRLSDWAVRVVLPHERTNPGPREERFGRLRMVGANLSPLYFLYRDPDGSIRDLIAESWQGAGERAGTDHMGGTHHADSRNRFRMARARLPGICRPHLVCRRRAPSLRGGAGVSGRVPSGW